VTACQQGCTQQQQLAAVAAAWALYLTLLLLPTTVSTTQCYFCLILSYISNLINELFALKIRSGFVSELQYLKK